MNCTWCDVQITHMNGYNPTVIRDMKWPMCNGCWERESL